MKKRIFTFLLATTLLVSEMMPVVPVMAATDEVILEEEFKSLGLDVTIVTSGFVTDSDMFKNGKYDYIYTCGPIPMLKAIYNGSTVSGQYSFEERMGCGFGACMGCSCKTKYGNKRICKDGPVLVKEEIIW